jgi:thiamine-phosphate pyrophosphorylase
MNRPTTMSPMPELRGLYAVTPDCASTEALLRDVGEVLAGGCRCLQYRDKSSNAELRRSRAQALQHLCQQSAAALLINDDVALALAVGAAGVHLGRDDGDLAAARAVLGAGKILGASCYADLALAERAVASGADYIAFGAMFISPSKPEAVQAPMHILGQARRLGVPVCAIGGITLVNAPQLIAAGADMLAVISDVFAAPVIAARAAAFESLFEEHHELSQSGTL